MLSELAASIGRDLPDTGPYRRIIPCLDVTGGRVVKGIEFVNLRDAGDPVELAAFYDSEGADELVFLDVTASSDGRSTMLDVVRRTAESVFIPLTVGGGVRAVADVDRLLRAGADKVAVNTAAVARPELIRAVRREVRVPVVASGGAGAVEHFPPAVAAGADAVLAASVFHFGELTIGDVKGALRAANHQVR